MTPSLFSNAEDVSSIVLVLYCKQTTCLFSQGIVGRGEGRDGLAPLMTRYIKKNYTHTLLPKRRSLCLKMRLEKIKRKKIYFYK